MHTNTLTQISKALQNKTISSVELVNDYFQRIEQHDPDIQAFITPTKEVAIEQAAEADKKLSRGNTNPLCGVPVAHKDVFCTKDILTTCGSKMLHNFVSPYDATVVSNLAEADMVMLGKTNMDEFAMGSTTENSAYQVTHNPWNTQKVPGGSSGGSAAAVAAGLVPVATGTDTGGSIRQPASLCGISGIKPTYGRVSRWGQIAYASSFDQGGLFAKSAEDLALVLSQMASYDEKDSTSANRSREDYSTKLNQSIKGLTVGIPKEYFTDGLQNEVADCIQVAITELEKMGAKVVDVRLPNNDIALSTYYILAPAEASSNLARYDGVRYGYRCDNPADLKDLYFRSRTEGFGEETKRRIMMGTYVLSAGYYDAYYLKAQKTRRFIRDGFLETLKQCDVILGPVSPSTAWDVGSKVDDPVSMYLTDIYTVPVNLAGLPAMSIPVGFSQDKMPIGMHLIGNYFAEAQLLNLAHQYQLHTDFHLQLPPQLQA